MRFTVKRRILNTIAIIFAISLVLFYDFFTKTGIGVAVLIAFLVASFILTVCWWRCPHCHSYLWKLAPFATHCPYCGNELE